VHVVDHFAAGSNDQIAMAAIPLRGVLDYGFVEAELGAPVFPDLSLSPFSSMGLMCVCLQRTWSRARPYRCRPATSRATLCRTTCLPTSSLAMSVRCTSGLTRSCRN
jgi:hypothetical protein